MALAASNALNLNGATIKDASGNAADLSGADGYNPAGTLQIDTTGPVATTNTFFDNFNRTDGLPGNGWIEGIDNQVNLVISNDVLTVPGLGGYGAIYRPVDLSGPVTISADITQKNGFGGLLKAYDTSLLLGSDGHDFSGYGIHLGRPDQIYAQSEVDLVYNGATLARLSSTFQFGAQVSVTMTLSPDGSIVGEISGDGNTFDFQFAARTVTYAGSNFEILQGPPDSRSNILTYPTIDNVSVIEDAVDVPPPPSALFTSGADMVDFNHLTPAQKQAINVNPFSIYNGLGGGDYVILPDVQNYQLTATVRWDSSHAFVAGDTAGQSYQIIGGDGTDKILLPGSPDNYTFQVEFTPGDNLPTATHTVIGHAPDVRLDTTGVERVLFTNEINGHVNLTDGSIAVEMLQLASESYSSYSFNPIAHIFDIDAEPLAYEGLVTGVPFEADNAENRGWHAVSAMELGMAPSDFGQGSVKFSFSNGFYQAIDPADTFLLRPSEADALVLTGTVYDSQKGHDVRTLAIVFRGTDQLADFGDYTDFKTHFDKFGPLIDKLQSYLSDTTNGIKQVLVSGHSLGSAMVDYFLSKLPATPPYSVQAYTDGYTGIELENPGAPVPAVNFIVPAVNFIHTDDLVSALGDLSHLNRVEKDAILTALGVAVAAVPGGMADGWPVIAWAYSIKKKSHEGSDVYLNSDVSNIVSTAEHDSNLYTKDVEKLYDFATDPHSLFSLFNSLTGKISELGTALRTGQVYQGPIIHIGVGRPDSRDVYIASNDDVDLGDKVDATGALVPIDNRFHWIGGKVHVIDGGGGVDTLVIEGPTNGWSAASIGFNQVDAHIELSFGGHVAAELYRIEKLQFDFGGWAQSHPIDLLTDQLSWSGGPVFSSLLQGSAIHGYLRGASVFSDANKNLQIDPGEAFASTDANGGFTLTGASGPLVTFGGIDTSTGLPFTGTLRAPEGSFVITPLTTLICALQDSGVVNAEAMVLASFGLDLNLDLLTLDPISATKIGDFWGSTAFVVGAEVADTLTMIASTLAGIDTSKFAAAWEDCISSIATRIIALAPGEILNLADANTVSALIDVVAQVEGMVLDPRIKDAAVSTIVASNAALLDRAFSDPVDASLVLDISAIQNVAEGEASNALKSLSADPDHAQSVLDKLTGTNFDSAVTKALNEITTLPVVSSLAADPTAGDLNAGQSVALILTMSKLVTVSGGTPNLILNDGGTATYEAAATAALGDANKLVFLHTVASGQNAADLAVTGINLNGASVQDLTNHDANLSGAISNPSGILIIDTTAPTLAPVGDQTDEATSAAGAVALFSATATDLMDGTDPVVFKEGSTVVHSGDTFSLGTHTITASAIDVAGNTTSETFAIRVVDTTAPVLAAIGDLTIHATGPNGAVVTFAATATDLVDGIDPVVFKDGSNVVHSGDIFGLGSHTITATATDTTGNATSEQFTIKVVDAPPVVTALTGSVGEDGPIFSQALLAGASDPDPGDLLSVAGLDASVTTTGGRTLVRGVDYTLTGMTLALTTAGFAEFNSLAALQTDQVVFHFDVSDGILGTANTLTLAVTGANDAPTLANQTASQSASAGTPFLLALPANTFQDPDSGDHLTLSATLSNGSALPSWLTFNAATATFSGMPGSGNAGNFDVKVTGTDTGGLAATDTFLVKVINHPPVITSDAGGATASIIITDDSKYVATVHATDPDPNTTLKYSIAGGTDQKLFTIDSSTGVLSFKSMPKDGHSYEVAVAASDGSLQDTQAIKVQVANGPFETGNSGVADTFVFKPSFGLAIVSKFDAASANHDVLELDHELFRNADAHMTASAIQELIQNHSFQFGPDVVIVTDTRDFIDLRNTDLHKLTAGDFLII